GTTASAYRRTCYGRYSTGFSGSATRRYTPIPAWDWVSISRRASSSGTVVRYSLKVFRAEVRDSCLRCRTGTFNKFPTDEEDNSCRGRPWYTGQHPDDTRDGRLPGDRFPKRRGPAQ